MANHKQLEEYRQSQDSSEDSIRSDPKKSSAVSSHDQFRKLQMGLSNCDPNRHYVGVYAQDGDALSRCEDVGYVVETVRQGGPKYSGFTTAKDGEPILFRGHILMSIDKKDLAAYNEKKQAQCDALRNRMRLKKEKEQSFTGVHGVIVDSHEVDIPAPV
jgi:hypothetical protein